MIRNPIVPVKNNPRNVDAALDGFATAMKDQLTWLTNAYGKCETRYEEGKSYPAIYVGDNDYLDLLPDQHLGNYLFIRVAKEDITPYPNRYLSDLEIEIYFYFDYREVYGDNQNKTIEHVKNDVYQAITRSATANNKVYITEFVEEKIYKDYTKKVDATALMRPFGALKVLAKYKATTTC